MVLLCGEDDEPLIKAAEGTLAILSRLEIDLEEIQEDQLDEEEKKRLKTYLDENRTIAEKIVQVKSFVEIFKHLVASPNMDIQFRALYIVRNLVRVNKQIATQIVESQLMDIFFAIKEMKDDRVANEKVFLLSFVEIGKTKFVLFSFRIVNWSRKSSRFV